MPTAWFCSFALPDEQQQIPQPGYGLQPDPLAATSPLPEKAISTLVA